jgi:probable rRNA maturation factor
MSTKRAARVTGTAPPATDADAIDVAVSYGCGRRGIPAPGSFARWVRAALAGQRRRGLVSIRIVDETEGRTLNRDYRHRDYATNVLSFPADPPPRGYAGPRLLGDLVLCAAVVEREAREQGKRPASHFAHLTVHGTLHLVGHDHMESAEAERMEALEVRILARLGIADPY